MLLAQLLTCFHETGSFSCYHNPTGFYSQRFWDFILPTLEPWVAQSVSLPSCSSQFICTRMWDPPLCQLPLRPVHEPPCLKLSPPWLPVSSPPTILDECFCFNSLVVGLPYSSIFWQFWLFFVFKFVVVLWVV